MSGRPPAPRRAGRFVVPLTAALFGILSLAPILGVGQHRVRALEHDRELGLRTAELRFALLAARSGSGGLDRAADLVGALRAEPEAPTEPLAAGIAELRRTAELTAGDRDRRLAELEAAAAALSSWVEVHTREHQRRVLRTLFAVVAGWVVVVAAGTLVLVAWERRRSASEEASRESRERLHRAQKMEAVGRLAGGLAHDVNNYLATIRAHCDLVLGKVTAGREIPRERLEEKMRLVIDTVLKASSLVERLLTFSRRQDTHPEVVDLNDVVETFVTLVRGSEGGRIEVETAPAADLWPVEADLSQLEQVLANLFVNARDAIGGAGRIRIETCNCPPAPGPEEAAAGEWVCLAVSDNGKGIPPELREKIFEPFFTTKESLGSSGLGLASVYGIVEGAGGSCEVESEVGVGSTFRVFLPRGRGEGRRVRAAGSAAGGCVLLVDDNAELRSAVAGLLDSHGYRVVEASSAEEAVEADEAAAAAFDVVITDVRLGVTSGPDLVARLRQRRPEADLKALYMSGYTDRIALRTGPGRGDAFFLKKPFSSEGLLRMVRELLAARAG